MKFPLREILLTLFFAPYVWYGIGDLIHHKASRRVGFTERLLHLTLGLILTIVVPHAYLGHMQAVIPGIFLFVLVRTLDEFVFHRGLSGVEVDLHAKTHFSFLVFVVGVLGGNTIPRWSLLP